MLNTFEVIPGNKTLPENQSDQSTRDGRFFDDDDPDDFEDPEDELLTVADEDPEPERLFLTVVPVFPVREPRVRGESTLSVRPELYPLLSKMLRIKLPIEGNDPLLLLFPVREGRRYSLLTFPFWREDPEVGANDFR